MRHPVWLVLLALAGCDDTLYPAIGENGSVSYSADWTGTQAFFGDHCEGCHPSLSEPDIEAIADDIIDGDGKYVVPFDPESSELWLVLNGQSDVTPAMPLGAAQTLPSDVIQPIADWIANGAPLN
ncbi:MAG: hypothetical protein R3F61_11545 [Myxococcota bacterium]